jgi:hypothetical protein
MKNFLHACLAPDIHHRFYESMYYVISRRLCAGNMRASEIPARLSLQLVQRYLPARSFDALAASSFSYDLHRHLKQNRAAPACWSQGWE